MERVLEFVISHYILVSLFVALLLALVVGELRSLGCQVEPKLEQAG